MAKIRVGVLRGGLSSEYDVSLKTGDSVLRHLPGKYQPVDILITKDGTWHAGGLPISPHNLHTVADVVFNALHGEFGEDGQVQKILDTANLPYTGSGHFASAVGMNKIYAKDIFAKNGLKVARHFAVDRNDDPEMIMREVFLKLAPPWIVKPANGGSSVGMSLVRHAHDLPAAVELALNYSDTALIEEYIRGREATCGVVENTRDQKIYALLPVEIIKPQESSFFDYEAKYSGASQEICPGNFSEEEKRELERLAAKVHEVLGLRHYSRTDFILSPRGIYVLEVNTLPGLTEQSLLPKSLKAVGIAYPDFLDHVISLALRDQKR